ncbi:hypothetical protein Pmi06nite_01990 [Planotetraspora mira]|uniref:Uncharacterized protein n=1 Tax=Planotetraspora mira TaxID=58121 RepID=A0A8J3TKC0_9ACTN|nr:hypothetical protein Pmi06nite_01990 [Planotetraspora mira]
MAAEIRPVRSRRKRRHINWPGDRPTTAAEDPAAAAATVSTASEPVSAVVEEGNVMLGGAPGCQ